MMGIKGTSTGNGRKGYGGEGGTRTGGGRRNTGSEEEIF